MRKTRTETAESRARIVANASRLFLSKGLQSVGTRDVMAASDMTQGGFYKHFASKEELIAVAHQNSVDHLFEMLGTAIAGKPPRQALELIVDIYLGQSPLLSETDLCPLAMLGSELKHEDEAVRILAMLGYDRFVDLIEQQLQLSGNQNAKVIAFGMSSALIGAVTLAGIAPTKAQSRMVLKEAASYVLRDLG